VLISGKGFDFSAFISGKKLVVASPGCIANNQIRPGREEFVGVFSALYPIF